MYDTLTQVLAGLEAAMSDRESLRRLLEPMFDHWSSQMHGDVGLVIKAVSSTLAKTGATATVGVVDGSPISVAAATDMAALSGTVPQNQYGVFVFYVDKFGAQGSMMGQPATNLVDVKFPTIPLKRAVEGYLIVRKTDAAFVGGTTALDAANTTVTYVNVRGAFDPTLRTGQ